MTARSVVAPILLFLAGVAVMWTFLTFRYASADDVPGPGPAVSMLFDAGPDTPVVAAPPPTQPPPPAFADPTQDSGGYARDMQSAFKAGRWVLLVVLGLFGLSRALIAAAAKWPRVAWLKTAAPYLVTAAAALGAIGASLSAGGAVDWNAVFGALGATGALYLTPTKAGQ